MTQAPVTSKIATTTTKPKRMTKAFLMLLLCLFCGYVPNVWSWSSGITERFGSAFYPPSKVLVTGAAGKTGRLVFQKLVQDPRYEPKALVRTEQSAKQVIHRDKLCSLANIVIGDVTTPTFQQDIEHELIGTEQMIICTSAVPRISRLSLLRALVKAPVQIWKRKPWIDYRSLQFKWKNGGTPEMVDYHGQIAQIDLAKKLGMKHVILVSSMGGTDPNNFLNSVGKKQDGSGNGDILIWKRRAEKYLVESGLSYTIIHPGGLVDTPAGQEEYILDVDDKLGRKYKKSSIGREDLAELCVAALSATKDANVSFDCITRERKPDSSSSSSSSSTKPPKSAEETLLAFVQESKTASYSM